jgi:hypothetical protein
MYENAVMAKKPWPIVGEASPGGRGGRASLRNGDGGSGRKEPTWGGRVSAVVGPVDLPVPIRI